MKREIMDLWRLCFDDTEDFIRFYFNKKYKDENALVYRDERGDAVAALQMPFYPMTFAGTLLQTAYISGACTHPSARGQGIMTRLLEEAFRVMRKRGIVASTLIPANAGLYDYYEKMGYATIFDFSPERYTLWDDNHSRGCFRVEALRDEMLFTDDVFHYFERSMLQRPCCVQHEREDFNLIVEDLRISGGALIVVYGEENCVVGMAFAESRKEHVLVKDWLFDSEEVKQVLARGVMTCLESTEIYCRALPARKNDEHRGMARIVDVEQVLRLYAAYHPEQHVVLSVMDGCIPENTGIYVVGEGGCSRKDTAHAAVPLTVQELTRLVFGYHPGHFPGFPCFLERLSPFMSLMLD